VGAQGVAVAAGIDGGIGHETGAMTCGPFIQGGRHDFRESGENRHFGPAAAVTVNLVAAPLLHVDPGVRGVHHRQLRFEKVVFDLQTQPPPMQDVERVLILAVRRSGDPFEGDLGVVVQSQDRTVRHEHGESRVRRRPDPITSQNRQMEFEFALGAGTSREQGRVSVQRADETVDAGESVRLFLAWGVRCFGAGRGEDDRKRESADQKRVSHLTVPQGIGAKGSYHFWD